MKVYTKTGDMGQTSLLSKQRVFKDNIRVEAYGTVDEVNAAMGLAKSFIAMPWATEMLDVVQNELILLNADLATEDGAGQAAYRIEPGHVARLEQWIDTLEDRRIPQRYFVTPGSCQASAALDLARTIVRRAERCAVRLNRSEAVSVPVMTYLNRLSDFLFVMARCVEQEEIVQTVTAKVLSVLREQEKNGNAGGRVYMLEKAKKMIAAAEQKAKEIKVPMVIAVVDAGGNLVAQHRMDDSLLASISISLNKAYTAVALKMTTAQAAAVAAPGQSLYGLHTTDSCRIVIFGGGLPIFEDGKIIGAIGVSGGSVEEDVSVAEAGLAAW